MSNRGRQNVASFLAKDLYMCVPWPHLFPLGVADFALSSSDWRVGAEFFESLLLDYDPCSNYGNWQYQAGCGNDPRGMARQFNPIKQAVDYDRDGAFTRTWLPELDRVSDARLQTPWR